MGTTVYVWLPNEGRVGHASMEIGTSSYVSFWPSDAAGKKDVKVGQSHDAAFPESYAADRQLEGGAADEKIALAGLDEAKMIDAWNELKQGQARYNLIENNCSTVVATLLEVGSGIKPATPTIDIDDYVRSLAGRLLFRLIFWKHTLRTWSPAGVRDYAITIRNASGP